MKLLNQRLYELWKLAREARSVAYRALFDANQTLTIAAVNAVYWRTGTPGATVPLRKSQGPSTAWDFQVGDLLYAECPILPDVDTTQDLVLGIKWAPWAAEAAKTVQYQLDIGFESVGTLVNAINVTKTTTVAVPVTQYEYSESDIVLTPAEWATAPLATIVHVRLTRNATGADPVTDPGVFHLRWQQSLIFP